MLVHYIHRQLPYRTKLYQACLRILNKAVIECENREMERRTSYSYNTTSISQQISETLWSGANYQLSTPDQANSVPICHTNRSITGTHTQQQITRVWDLPRDLCREIFNPYTLNRQPCFVPTDDRNFSRDRYIPIYDDSPENSGCLIGNSFEATPTATLVIRPRLNTLKESSDILCALALCKTIPTISGAL